ncbi:MAG: N-acetylmuramoyl-L-alanine amidase [Clostridia bacterium]|nr:N-acetylmuramoyl-L-alanine amidase [Clostridia bacterium]
MKIIAPKALLARLWMLLALTGIVSGLLIGYRVIGRPSVTVSAGRQSFSTVVIDPGHGGFDGGASAEDGTLEKTINLQIALAVRDCLDAMGVRTVMTRTQDSGTNDADAGGLHEKKVSDLNNRLALMHKDQNRIFVSIHQNHFSESQYYGTQVFYSGNHPDSIQLAECIRASVVTDLQPENRRELKRSGSEIYLLHHAQVPAVMVECGFLSNAAETAKLKSEPYQKQLAFLIALGILDYLQAEEQHNGF